MPGKIELADRLLQGRVSRTIAELQALGATQEHIAEVLVDLYDLPVNRITVLRYLRRNHTELKEPA